MPHAIGSKVVSFCFVHVPKPKSVMKVPKATKTRAAPKSVMKAPTSTNTTARSKSVMKKPCQEKKARKSGTPYKELRIRDWWFGYSKGWEKGVAAGLEAAKSGQPVAQEPKIYVPETPKAMSLQKQKPVPTKALSLENPALYTSPRSPLAMAPPSPLHPASACPGLNMPASWSIDSTTKATFSHLVSSVVKPSPKFAKASSHTANSASRGSSEPQVVFDRTP